METDWKKKYEEALSLAKSYYGKDQNEFLDTLFPELRESDDERIRKKLIEIIGYFRSRGIDQQLCEDFLVYLEKQKESLHVSKTCKENADSFTDEDEMSRKWILEYLYDGLRKSDEQFKDQFKSAIAWLEKQKAKERLDRMAPIYNDKESFESALEKAWKYYNESASRTVDSFEDDYIECVFSKGFREGFLYREKQKEQKPAESISQLTVQGKGVYKICPHCKERMVRDDSKVYTSMPPQYGYNCPKCGAMEFDTVMYDNPEMEEQKPPITGNDFGWIDELKHDLEHPEELDQKVNDVLKQRKGIRTLEWNEEDNIGWDEAFACVTRAEEAAKNEEELQNAVTAERWLKEIKFKYYVHPVRQEWSEEDEDNLRRVTRIIEDNDSDWKELIAWLKSLRPSWKPSEEQPEVDLEKEIDIYLETIKAWQIQEAPYTSMENTARHFYELRNRALEEAARHVYESWMGGTTDDVRRDMVELGRLINARKEENK